MNGFEKRFAVALNIVAGSTGAIVGGLVGAIAGCLMISSIFLLSHWIVHGGKG